MPLKRVIGLREALAINIGAIIGAGIFVISGLATGIAGPATIIAILIGGFISILTGLSYAQLSYVYPLEGGSYEYARKIYGSFPGLVVGLMFIVSSIVGGTLVALSFGSYFASIFGSSLSVPLIAAALIAALGVVNYFGVKSTADMSLILTLIKVLILVFFIIIGIFFIHPQNYTPFLPNGYGSLFEASAFIFFSYTGFARVTSLGEEVKNPKKTIPQSIIYSIVISTIIYALVIVVLIGIVPYGSVANSQSPLQYAIHQATGNALFGFIVSIGALFATVNVALSMILGISRVGFAMARDGNLPGPMRHINRFNVPDLAIIVPTILMMCAVFVSFKEVASLSNVSALLGYSIANVAAIKFTLSYRKRDQLLFKSKFFAIIPLLGVITATSLIFFLTTSSLYIMVLLIVGIAIYAVVYRKMRHKPINISSLFKS